MADAQSGPCTVIAKGGVGESGASTMLYGRVGGKTAKLMLLKTVETSLCGNTGAVAVLLVNGHAVAHGVITDKGASIQAEANPGDNVVAVVHTVPLFNEIMCIRLGELSVELNECDFVG